MEKESKAAARFHCRRRVVLESFFMWCGIEVYRALHILLVSDGLRLAAPLMNAFKILQPIRSSNFI